MARLVFINPSMLHWIKFNVVGVLGFALQSGTLFILTHTAYPISYLAATAVAVELAVLNNFVWHQRWTWNDRPAGTKKETLRRLAKFNITTGLVSLAGNLVLMDLLVGHFRLPIAGANLASVAACSIVNFILSDRIAFEVNETSTSEPEAVATGQILNSNTLTLDDPGYRRYLKTDL